MNANELREGDVIKFRHVSKRSSRIAVIRSIETGTNMLGEKVISARVLTGINRTGDIIFFSESMKWEYLYNEISQNAEIVAEYDRLFA